MTPFIKIIRPTNILTNTQTTKATVEDLGRVSGALDKYDPHINDLVSCQLTLHIGRS